MCRSSMLFYLCSYQLVLLPCSCVDLHKRRKHRLRPKRIVVTGFFALVSFLSRLWTCLFVILTTPYYSGSPIYSYCSLDLVLSSLLPGSLFLPRILAILFDRPYSSASHFRHCRWNTVSNFAIQMSQVESETDKFAVTLCISQWA